MEAGKLIRNCATSPNLVGPVIVMQRERSQVFFQHSSTGVPNKAGCFVPALGEEFAQYQDKLLMYMVVYKVIVFGVALIRSVFWWDLQI